MLDDRNPKFDEPYEKWAQYKKPIWSRVKHTIPLFMLTLFAVIGVAVIASALYDFYLASTAKTWHRIDGRVLSSETKVNRGLKSTSYFPCVRYEYKIQGKTYAGDVVRMGSSSAYKSEAMETVSRFNAGEKVTVFFNPNMLSMSVLEPGKVFSGVYVKLAIGIAFSACGIFLSWAVIRNK